MLPISENANTVINENSPTDARQLLTTQFGTVSETKLFYGPMFSDMYAGQDDIEPYIDDKPKYERDYKLNKYVIVNNWEGAKVNSHCNHRGILPRLWSPEHENYINFTGPLNFKLSSDNKNSDELKSVVSEFYQQQLDGELTEKTIIISTKIWQDI